MVFKKKVKDLEPEVVKAEEVTQVLVDEFYFDVNGNLVMCDNGFEVLIYSYQLAQMSSQRACFRPYKVYKLKANGSV